MLLFVKALGSLSGLRALLALLKYFDSKMTEYALMRCENKFVFFTLFVARAAQWTPLGRAF